MWGREGGARPEGQRVLWGSHRDRLGWGRVSGEGGVTRAGCRRRISGESHGLGHVEGKVCEGKMGYIWLGLGQASLGCPWSTHVEMAGGYFRRSLFSSEKGPRPRLPV